MITILNTRRTPPAIVSKVTRFPLLAASLTLLLLTGCTAAPATTDVGASDAAADTTDDTATADAAGSDGPGGNDGGGALARIANCDVVEAAVAPYIQSLVPMEGNVVDEWGVSCRWEMAEGETDWDNNRSVGVGIAAEPTEKPDVALLADASDSLTALDDAWVAQQGGVAYTLTMETSVAAAIVTTVWLPYAEVTVSGGKWGDHPPLDGPAAVQVVSSLLG